MLETRRGFLWCAGAAISGTVLELRMAAQNPRRGLPTPPEGANQDSKTPAKPKKKLPSEAILREHEKAFRDCLNALSSRMSQLNQDVENLHSAEIFSVGIYKQTTEIERLAKQLKSLAKG